MPVLYVVHDADGGWQMLCGGDEHDEPAEVIVLHREHFAERDPSVTEVFDLPPGWEAERRAPGEPWKRAVHFEEDDAEGL